MIQKTVISTNSRVAIFDSEDALADGLNNGVYQEPWGVKAKGGKFVWASEFPSGEFVSAEAQAMLDTYTSVGVALAGSEREQMINYVNQLATNGHHDLIDYDCIYSLAGVNALVDWKGGKVATNNGATFDVNGATSNGVDQYLDTNWVASIDGINWALGNSNAQVFIKSVNILTNQNPFGVRNGGLTRIIEGTSAQYRVNNSLVGANPPYEFANKLGLNGVSIGASDRVDAWLNGVSLANATGSQTGIPTDSIYVGCLRESSAPANFFSGTISSFIVGAAIGFDQVSYNTTLRALLTGLGALP